MSAIFFRCEVIGYASGTGVNPYTVNNPHTEAINLDQFVFSLHLLRNIRTALG